MIPTPNIKISHHTVKDDLYKSNFEYFKKSIDKNG